MIEDEVFQSLNADNVQNTIDMRSMPEKQAFSPVESLLASVAACAAVDIVAILKKRKKTILEFEITTKGVRQDNPPRFFTKIHCLYKIVSPDITEEELYKVAELSLFKYCSVAASLKAEITFEVQIKS